MNDQLILMESNLTEVKFHKEGFKLRNYFCKDRRWKMISDYAAIESEWKEHFQQLF